MVQSIGDRGKPRQSGKIAAITDAVRPQKLMTAVGNERLLISDAHTAVDVDPVSLL